MDTACSSCPSSAPAAGHGSAHQLLVFYGFRTMRMRKKTTRMMMKTQGWEMKAMTVMKELVALMAMMDMKQMMLR